MATSNSNDDSSWKNVHNQRDWEPSSDDDDDDDNHELFYDAPETTPPITTTTTEVNREAELLHERLNSQLSTSETVEKKKTPG